MFDYEAIDPTDYEDGQTEEIEFIYTRRNANGHPLTSISRRIVKEDDECVFLPEVLREFTYFLNGMTFTYVGGVSAQDMEGKDVAYSDTI